MSIFSLPPDSLSPVCYLTATSLLLPNTCFHLRDRSRRPNRGLWRLPCHCHRLFNLTPPSYSSPDPLLTSHCRLALFHGAPKVVPCHCRPALSLPPSSSLTLSNQDSLLMNALKQLPFLTSPGVRSLYWARPPLATRCHHRPVTLRPRSPCLQLYLPGSNLATPSRSFLLTVSFTQLPSTVFSS